MKKCINYEVKTKINLGFSSEDISNVIANELKKYLKLQIDVEMVPKEILSRLESSSCNKNSDHEGKRLIVEGDVQSSNLSFIDDSSKFSFAGV